VVNSVKPQQAVGIDISLNAIQYAAEKRPQLDVLVGDAEALPFRDATFEAIFASEVMEHILAPDRLLGEIKRCLADGGYAVVMVPAETPLFKFLWFFWTRFGKGRSWRHAHVQDFGGDELDRVVQEAGFTVLKDRRFMLGMLRALKIGPGSAA
jgi:ubiquinone/menaquinone biosynthesis C-methylase UbiE